MLVAISRLLEFDDDLLRQALDRNQKINYLDSIIHMPSNSRNSSYR